MAYVAPALRKNVKVQITSLGPENFPEFGSTCKRTNNHNFLARVLKGEEERLTQQRDSIYDPTKISNLTHSQLRNEGWEVLLLGNPLSWFIDWNDRLVTGRKPVVVERRLPAKPILAEPLEDSEYELEQELPDEPEDEIYEEDE